MLNFYDYANNAERIDEMITIIYLLHNMSTGNIVRSKITNHIKSPAIKLKIIDYVMGIEQLNHYILPWFLEDFMN